MTGVDLYALIGNDPLRQLTYISQTAIARMLRHKFNKLANKGGSWTYTPRLSENILNCQKKIGNESYINVISVVKLLGLMEKHQNYIIKYSM